MSYFYSKENIYNELHRLDEELGKIHQHLYLEVIGGAALILNGLTLAETEDIDTIVALSEDVKEILEQCYIDINDEASDYKYEFQDGELIESDEPFSNITLRYFDIQTVIKTKLRYYDEYKAQRLYELMEDGLEIEMSVKGIKEYFDDFGIEVDTDDIESFLNFVDEY